MTYCEVIDHHDEEGRRQCSNGQNRNRPCSDLGSLLDSTESIEDSSQVSTNDSRSCSIDAPGRIDMTGKIHGEMRDPPSSYECHRRRMEIKEKENAATKYSAIRFAKELEIYPVELSGSNSYRPIVTPTKSILKNKKSNVLVQTCSQISKA